jgi:Ala-tRNA(Pro) deacylase
MANARRCAQTGGERRTDKPDSSPKTKGPAMIAPRLSSYLFEHDAQYEICVHPHSHCSAGTARVAHVAPHQLAKSVLLEDDAGLVLAIIPADRQVQLGEVARLLGRRQMRLSDEGRIATLFDDCEPGAVPALGMAWGVETIVDDELEANEVVYIEGGDHERLLRLSREQFRELMSPLRHGHFCRAPLH